MPRIRAIIAQRIACVEIFLISAGVSLFVDKLGIKCG